MKRRVSSARRPRGRSHYSRLASDEKPINLLLISTINGTIYGGSNKLLCCATTGERSNRNHMSCVNMGGHVVFGFIQVLGSEYYASCVSIIVVGYDYRRVQEESTGGASQTQNASGITELNGRTISAQTLCSSSFSMTANAKRENIKTAFASRRCCRSQRTNEVV